VIASISVIKILNQISHKQEVQDFLTCSGWMGPVHLQISYLFKTLNIFYSLHHLEVSLPSVLFHTSVWMHVKHSTTCSCYIILGFSVIYLFIYLFIYGFSRQGFSVQPWLSWNSLCRPDWPRTQKSASQVLGLKVCATTVWRIFCLESIVWEMFHYWQNFRTVRVCVCVCVCVYIKRHFILELCLLVLTW
jgi:vacuolar-type H+-ATPase subunit I/STV1